MIKPTGYTVYDLEPVIDWMAENYEVTNKQLDKFREDILTCSNCEIVFLSTEDCKNISLLKEVLDEFGTLAWTNRGGVDQYEVYVNVG